LGLILLAAGSLACRLEVGFSPANAAPEAPESAAVPASSPPDTQAASETSTQAQPAPTDVAAPEQEQASSAATPAADESGSAAAPASSDKAAAEPAASPTPAPTPTPMLPANSPPSRIVIPSIKLDSAVDLTTWQVSEENGAQISNWVIPSDVPGWHVNSALPGHGSNVVLSGHHNIGREVFKNLIDVKQGEPLTLKADGREYHYTITDRFVVPERGVPQEQQIQNARWIMPTVDERVTLVTCWPYQDNSHRVIVIAKPATR